MNLKFKLALLLVMFVNICTFAQETYTLKGKVTSKVDNEGLPGVSIRILDSNVGSETDLDGSFTIQVKKGDVLEFSYLGFSTQKFTIDNQKNLNVVLEEDNSILDEIVVVG